ncbi:Lrp/AsnC family transcriptional regulator [Vibrio cholerae]
MKLDQTDIKILKVLQDHGRITNTELAERVSLSPSPCLQRVKKLEKNGFIIGYTAQLALNKLGNYVTVFAEVTLKDHHPQHMIKFQNDLAKIDQVIECHLISAGYDYLIKFVTESIGQYQEIMEKLVDSDAKIDKYFSFVVMKSAIVKSHIPINNLAIS